MTSILTDQLRAPPDVIEQHRQALIVDELFVFFERLDQLGKNLNAVEVRRDRIHARLSDASLLEIHPKGSEVHETARNKYDELDLLAGRLRDEITDLAGKVNLKLKRIKTDRFDAVCRQIGGAYKDEPVWKFLRGIPLVEKSGEWQDLIAGMLQADDDRPPF
jgi:hypothetical protein